MATIKDIAALAGVTVTTVSRMLNNRYNVSEQTKKKIYAAMKELNYQPNELAQSLTKKKSKFIGLIVPSANNFFFSEIIQSVEHYVTEHGYKMLLCVSDLRIEKEVEYLNMLKANKVTGIILASHTQNLMDYITLDSSLITIERTLSSQIPSACSDNYAGGRIAAEHLISKGCRNLVYFSGSKQLDMDANKRFLGFRDTCLLAGVKAPVIIDANEKRFISMEYSDIIQELLRNYPETDGIMASNDVIAVQIIQYCGEHQIAVPERLKIIGYDDTRLATLCVPRLTTIHQPIDDICRYSVEILINASNGLLVPSSMVFPVRLIQRETT